MASDNMNDLDGWVEVSCSQSENILAGITTPTVFSALTDPDGFYGTGVVYTEWGDAITDKPLLRNYRWSEQGRSCQHYVPAN